MKALGGGSSGIPVVDPSTVVKFMVNPTKNIDYTLAGEIFEDLQEWDSRVTRMAEVLYQENPAGVDESGRGFRKAYHKGIIAVTYCCVGRAAEIGEQLIKKIFEHKEGLAKIQPFTTAHDLWARFASEFAQALGPTDKAVYWLHRLGDID